MGPGDEVFISIWGDVQKSFEIPVDATGAINVPVIGQVIVGGLTLSETKKILIKKLKDKKVLIFAIFYLLHFVIT